MTWLMAAKIIGSITGWAMVLGYLGSGIYLLCEKKWGMGLVMLLAAGALATIGATAMNAVWGS